MMNILLVAIGSAMGGVMRYGLARVLPVLPGEFPRATFLANLSGSFVIGLCYVLIVERGANSESLRLFWMTGILGGYTTYSAFALETTIALGEGAMVRAGLYVATTVIACLLAALAGRYTATLFS